MANQLNLIKLELDNTFISCLRIEQIPNIEHLVINNTNIQCLVTTNNFKLKSLTFGADQIISVNSQVELFFGSEHIPSIPVVP